MKKLVIVVTIIVLIVLIATLVTNRNDSSPQNVAINSFEDCVVAGNPVMESYPPQCRTSDGRTFTQDIGNEMQYIDEIRVDFPRPNQTISRLIYISGEARGQWFFEASFSAELFDANNNSLGVAILQADGEWMTEEFVPFSGELTFENPETPTGTLVISNANPSGLPEMDKKLEIPISFE